MVRLALSFVFSLLLVACGGGGGGGNYDPKPPPEEMPPPPTIVVVKHEITVSAQAITVKLAVEGDQITHLVKGGQPASVPVSTVKTVVWNGQCVGWVSVGGNGLRMTFSGNPVIIPGLRSSDRGIVSILTDSDEYFLNLDHIQVAGDGISAAIKDGGIWYGDIESPSLSCSNPNPQPSSHHVAKITATGTFTFTPAAQGDVIIGLFKDGTPVTLPFASVTDVRLSRLCGVWWSTPTSGGLLAKFVNTVASFIGLPASDVVMVSLVDVNGVEYFLDTNFIDVVGEGVTVMVRDGLIRYGAATDPAFTCPP